MRHILKGLTVVVILVGLLGLAWWRYQESLVVGSAPPPGVRRLNQMEAGGVPEFTLKDLKDRSVSLSDFKDRPVILSFWASWCDPCIAEFPSMVKLVKRFGGRIVMVAVSADHSKEDIESFLKPYGELLTNEVVVLWDKDREVAGRYGTEVLPESYVLAPGLKVIRKVSGTEDWFTPGAIEFFQAVLDGKIDEKGG